MKTSAWLSAVMLVATVASAQVRAIEREALIALYQSTDGDDWYDNTNWLGDVGTECTWYGVWCSLGKVRSLGLHGNHLRGTIPPELGNLSRLRYLSLHSNQLSGSIPPELGNLSWLQYLYLDRNQLSGSIPAELGDLSSLALLQLYSNQLSGNIPPELGNLSRLMRLLLSFNRLSGSLPAALGSLPSLKQLSLSSNRLSGSIPAELGDLSRLRRLGLYSNQLSGSIPAELGNLSGLRYLYLYDNQLSGSIPPELGGLSNLVELTLSSNNIGGSIPLELGDLTRLDPGDLDIGYNALWTDDAALQAFLDSKDSDWDHTQTIAPSDLTVTSVTDHTAWLEWTPILYTGDTGGYEVFSEVVVARTPTSGGHTTTKSDTTFPMTGLVPGQVHDLTVNTFTRPHSDNQNTVVSELTSPVIATTSLFGCAEPVVESGSGWPRTLTVTSSHDTFEWSTGETTSSIVVSPSMPTWYWVRAWGPGPCDEAAVVLVDGTAIFSDGFESGDTTNWSVSVP